MLKRTEIVISKTKVESYIEKAIAELKNISDNLEAPSNNGDPSFRYISLAKTKLQEAWLWCDQIEKHNSEIPM